MCRELLTSAVLGAAPVLLRPDKLVSGCADAMSRTLIKA